MSSGAGPEIDRAAWWGVAFFVGMGLALLAVGSPALGWVSIGVGLASLAALLAVRAGWNPSQRLVARATGADLGADLAPVHRDRPQQPFPALSREGEAEVDRLVSVLSRAGVLSPDTPDPRFLYPAVADRGEPVTVNDILRCLGEVDYWHPEVDARRYAANLAEHDNHVEQWEDYLADQIADVAALAGGTVPVVIDRIHQEFVGGDSTVVRNRLDLTVGGRPLHLDYLGVSKYLSTVLHVELARALRAAGAPRRIAWLVEDDTLLTGLPDQDLDRLNADLGLPPADPRGWGGWTWVDECQPEALGERDATSQTGGAEG